MVNAFITPSAACQPLQYSAVTGLPASCVSLVGAVRRQSARVRRSVQPLTPEQRANNDPASRPWLQVGGRGRWKWGGGRGGGCACAVALGCDCCALARLLASPSALQLLRAPTNPLTLPPRTPSLGPHPPLPPQDPRDLLRESDRDMELQAQQAQQLAQATLQRTAAMRNATQASNLTRSAVEEGSP